MNRSAFSLVEVVIALGVISFALLVLLALLPLGLQTNHLSTQETQATCVLTSLEADLRDTYPSANGGKSKYFGLMLPYAVNGLGRVTLNPAVTANTVSSIGLSEGEITNNPAAVPPPAYQASVVYTRVPGAGMLAPMEARLVVSWPCRNVTDPTRLTSTNIAGYVESYVSFPAP